MDSSSGYGIIMRKYIEFEVNKMIERRGIVLSLYDLHKYWPQWLSEAGLNVFALHNWRADNNHELSINEIIEYIQSYKGERYLAELKAAGMEIEYELHALSWLLPRKLYDRHPQWFRMNQEGIRIPDGNFCPSNNEALEFIAENAVKLAQILKPTTNRYYMWPDDGRFWCNCDKCRELSASDQNLITMNHILKALRRTNPGAMLACLAYMNTLNSPPTKVRPLEGIFLEFTGPGVLINSRECERILSVREYGNFLDTLKLQLDSFGPENAQVLEYWLDASAFSKWSKPARKLPFDRKTIFDDIGCYHSMGFKSVTTFGVFLDSEYYARYGKPPVDEYGKCLGEY
jgi:hypothetical protein